MKKVDTYIWLLYVILALGIIPLCLIHSSCTKKLSEINHKDTTINVPNPPYYNGVSSLLIKAYINKLYIDLLGRVPTDGEAQAQFTYLTSRQLRMSARDSMTLGLLNTRDFAKRLFAITSGDILGGADSAQIVQELNLFKYVSYLDSSANRTTIGDKYEITRLNTLQNAVDGYYSNSITINAFYRAFIDNAFYDQINMGTENFVKASFNGLLRRNATTSELAAGENIVNGSADVLFLQSGNSKGNFENIITTTSEFYQGLVIKAYTTFLNRQPTSFEQGVATTLLQSTHNYHLTLQNIVSTKEYAGF